MTFRRTFTAPVRSIAEHTARQYVSGFGDNVVFQEISLGWFILLSGSWESIFVGMEKPDDLKVGDVIDVTLAKRPAETPR